MVDLQQSVESTKFLEECIKVSWSLLGNVPPLLSWCPPKEKFDRHMHVEVSGKNSGVKPDEELVYSRPILTNVCGNVYVPGTVRSKDKGEVYNNYYIYLQSTLTYVHNIVTTQ